MDIQQTLAEIEDEFEALDLMPKAYPDHLAQWFMTAGRGDSTIRMLKRFKAALDAAEIVHPQVNEPLDCMINDLESFLRDPDNAATNHSLLDHFSTDFRKLAKGYWALR